MIIVSTDYKIEADTLQPGLVGKLFAYRELIERAEDGGGAASIVFFQNRAYQLVVVPLLAPDPIAWICAGFIVDDALAREFQQMTHSNISFLRTDNTGEKWAGLASTLPRELLKPLLAALPGSFWKTGKSFSLDLAGDEYVCLTMPIGGKENLDTKVVMQRSMREALAPFQPLRARLSFLFGAGLLGAIIGAVLISRSVTGPVNKLVSGVRKIASGDFTSTVKVEREDEIGELAGAFNQMTRGLAERDRVRDLLGKVVSPEVAEQLMRKGLELGGEEREVTILFSDIRGFTTISERRAPRDLLDILNTYLTRMSDIVEKHDGVVDKYVGDEVMAIFGAPLASEDHADNALKAALDMIRSLAELNEEFAARGIPTVRIGIGINTAVVVAGNMGSKSRMNYTVIGDGVNLASRLESLTKIPEYNAVIIVGEATLAKAKGKYKTRFLGRVAVKGKSEETDIYALDGK